MLRGFECFQRTEGILLTLQIVLVEHYITCRFETISPEEFEAHMETDFYHMLNQVKHIIKGSLLLYQNAHYIVVSPYFTTLSI